MNGETSDKLRDNIKAIVAKRRIPKKELAETAGIHPDTLRFFLSGKSDMTISLLARIAKALDMTVTGLINWRAK